MMYKTNTFALVGSSKNPKYTPNKVILWDDYQTKELNEFRLTSTVKNIKLKKDKIIIVCEQRIYIYDLEKYKQLEIIETFKNEIGTIGVNADPDFTVIGYPINPQGFIKVKFDEKSQEVEINAHDSIIPIIAINYDGTLVVTASDRGHLIRVFCITNGEYIEDFRRGSGKACISCVSFDEYSNWLGVCSEEGIIHIFSLGSVWKKVQEKGEDRTRKPPNDEELPKNDISVFKGLPRFLGGKSFQADKSFAQVKIDQDPAICAILSDNTIIAITGLGKFYQAKLNPKSSGVCKITFTEDISKKSK